MIIDKTTKDNIHHKTRLENFTKYIDIDICFKSNGISLNKLTVTSAAYLKVTEVFKHHLKKS